MIQTTDGEELSEYREVFITTRNESQLRVVDSATFNQGVKLVGDDQQSEGVVDYH